MERTKFVLDEDRIPRAFYNIAADLPEPPPPPLHPGTGQPIGPQDLAPLFPMELIKQVVSTDREIEIPDPVRQAYTLYRPSPLFRAHRLEQALQTPAHIYYKYEGVSAPGSHKPNTAIAQAFYAKQEGVTRFATETGAGQWGVLSLSPGVSSESRSRSSWSAPATTRSPTDASSWRRMALRSCRAPALTRSTARGSWPKTRITPGRWVSPSTKIIDIQFFFNCSAKPQNHFFGNNLNGSGNVHFSLSQFSFSLAWQPFKQFVKLLVCHG